MLIGRAAPPDRMSICVARIVQSSDSSVPDCNCPCSIAAAIQPRQTRRACYAHGRFSGISSKYLAIMSSDNFELVNRVAHADGLRTRAQSSPPCPRRSRLTSPRRLLSFTRRRCEPRVGRVAVRGASTCKAALSSSCNRAPAASRFASCDRSESAVTRNVPSAPIRRASRVRIRERSNGVSKSHDSNEKRSVTRVLTLFRCCPPGPPPRSKSAEVHSISA